jgi:O-methyltransferase
MRWFGDGFRSGKHVLKVMRVPGRQRAYPDFEPAATTIISAVESHTMTSPERIYALIKAVEYVVATGIEGDFVECGVWQGGSMMAAALTLGLLHETERHLYLFDTFEGMPPPSDQDVDVYGRPALGLMRSARPTGPSIHAVGSEETVRANMDSVSYPQGLVHLVKGRVEDTLPSQAPARIALLRLDTDWYVSTKCEMVHLYPRLSKGGVLIVDDYGHWRGAKRAVDEYLNEERVTILLNRIDYTGRIGIKI